MDLQLGDIIRPGRGQGLDFISLEELRKRTGIAQHEVFEWALNEMLCNSLDTDATMINITVRTEGEFDELTVSDNGSKKIEPEDLEKILNFMNKASSKRGWLRVSRGYLGNALKCIFGYSYALSMAKKLDPPEIVISSHGTEYQINLHLDLINDAINSEIASKNCDNKCYHTSFTVKFPSDRTWTRTYFRDTDLEEPIREKHRLTEILFATGLVNPTRRISYDLWGEKGEIGKIGKPLSLRHDTSILWYTKKAFTELLFDYIRAIPNVQLKSILSEFRGFTSKRIQRQILHELNAANHDSQPKRDVQFFPATPIKELSPRDAETLYLIMRERGKPIGKRSIQNVLGVVGEERFEKVGDKQGWLRVKYTLIKDWKRPSSLSLKGDVSYPFLIELAVFDREEDDEEGLKVYRCVNFMASRERLFSRVFDISHRLGQVGINDDTPVTILVHLVCPVLEWLNYAKTSIGGKHIGELMKKAFNKILPIPRKPKKYRINPPAKPVSWLPRGKITTKKYREKLKPWAETLKFLDTQRGKILEKLSPRGWPYLLEGMKKIDKGDFDACGKAINDCIKLGYLPIDFTAQDQDPTRRFSGIHEASDPSVLLKEIKNSISDVLDILPHHTTDYWKGEGYYVMVCVEKIDIFNLFEPICREYNVPIVNSKGWYTLKTRYRIAILSRKAEERGLVPVLLLFYDHDLIGLKISERFRKGLRDMIGQTKWDPTNLIIDRFGLNYDDIEKHGLMWIPNLKSSSGKDPDYRRRDVREYIRMYGERKCEANALTRNEETLRIGQRICRDAIERYYGKDALERFEKKREQAKEELEDVYDDSMWKVFQQALEKTIERYEKKEEEEAAFEAETEYDVFLDNRYYGKCPKCGRSFNYDEADVGRLVRCRWCNSTLRLRWTGEKEETSP